MAEKLLDHQATTLTSGYLIKCIFQMCPLAGMDVPGRAAGPDEAVVPEQDALEFSLDIVRSYPKAGPRKITKRRGRKRHLELLLHLISCLAFLCLQSCRPTTFKVIKLALKCPI